MNARKKTKRPTEPTVRVGPGPDDAHSVVYFKRHREDDPEQAIPGQEFLREKCPPKVRAFMRAVLADVAAAPPMRFSGGGYWEAMKGDMTGWYEVRKDGQKRHHYRLFCLLDYSASGLDRPLLVVVDGREKAFQTKLPAGEYEEIKRLGAEYLSRNPRSLA